MTALSPASRSSGLRRKVLLGAALLALLAVGVGIAFWLGHRPPSLPTPPDVPATETERAVLDTVRAARERVLREPRSARAWGALGEVFLANDMAEECLECFAQAELLEPDNPHWPYDHGRALLSQAAAAAALPYLRRTVLLGNTRDPDNLVPRLFLVETLLSLGEREEAEENLQPVLEREPDNLRACFYRGILAFSEQRWQASRDDFRRCLGCPFAQKKACIKLAQAAQALGQKAEADRLRHQAEELPADQDWPDPYVMEYMQWAQKKNSRYELAELLEGAGRLGEAASILRPLVDQDASDYRATMLLTRVLGLLGDYKGAEQVLRRCLEIAPERVGTQYSLSIVLLMKGEHLQAGSPEEQPQAQEAFEEAVERARRALKQKPDYALAYMTLGRSLKHLGKREQARAALAQAVHCNPEYGELHYYLGDLLADLGEQAEARRQLEQALQLTARAPWREAARTRLEALSAQEKKGRGQ